MIFDLQKASMWKRISAWLFDSILLVSVVVLFGLLLSWMLAIFGGTKDNLTYSEIVDSLSHSESLSFELPKQSVGAENVREDIFTGIDLLHLSSAVLHGSKVVVGSVNGLAGLDAELLLVGVRPDHRQKDRGKRDEDDHAHADEGDLVLVQALAAVLEEGGGGAHLYHVLLLGIGSQDKIVQVDLEAEGFLIHNST